MAGSEMRDLLPRAEERSKEHLKTWDVVSNLFGGKRIKVVYVAGPYRAKNDEDKWRNIMRARDAARSLWLEGFAVICPHLNSMLMDGEDTEGLFLAGDKEILKRCDVIYLLKGWEESEGARAECEIAKESGVEIVYEK